MYRLGQPEITQLVGDIIQKCHALSTKQVDWQEGIGIKECQGIRRAARHLLDQTGQLLQDLARGQVGEVQFCCQLRQISEQLACLNGATKSVDA